MEPYFYNPYHYHPEYELTAIIRGSGTRYIGDSIDKFGPGDLVLVGSNLSHLWKCDDKYYNEDADLTVRAIVIQFNRNFLGEDFWSLKEMKGIKKLLLRSKRGVRLNGDNRIQLQKQILDLLNCMAVERVTGLLSILNIIAKTDDYDLLASPNFANINKASDKKKINEICSFVIDNFQNDIYLHDVADIAHMTRPAFCRFFKKETNKTFFSYLNEVRIGYACKLLIDDSFSISQIALESGFNTISYFNRQFKKIMDQTPSHYRSRFK